MYAGRNDSTVMSLTISFPCSVVVLTDPTRLIWATGGGALVSLFVTWWVSLNLTVPIWEASKLELFMNEKTD